MTSISHRNRRLLEPICIGVTTTLLLGPTLALAQSELEEIVVTAQRREQLLQDVPISIEVYSMDMIQKEGFNNLEELSAFAPGVFVNEGGDQGSDTFIRGFGTVGRNWANDSATPMFLDNVNLGQASMGAIAFMDTQRVEILKGPQPIHFGLNATGGALSIVSARPTQEWSGYVNAEAGISGDWSQYKRFGDREIEAAVGGPITDTLAFRVAGLYQSRDGHLRDAVTGFPMGYRNFLGTRLALDWRPNDKLSIYSKLELAQQRWDSTTRVCRRDGDYPNRFERRDPPSLDPVETDPTAVWIGYDEGGTGWSTPILGVDRCGQGGEYLGQTTAFEAPTVGVRTRDTTSGFMDIRGAAAAFLNTLAGGRTTANPVTFGEDGTPGWRGDGNGVANGNGYQDGQFQEPTNFQVELNYQFDNGIGVQWTNNYMDSYYSDASVGRNTPYVENIRNRLEDYEQKSSEVRISQYGGAFEWMVGAFIQDEHLHFKTTDYRAEIRFGNRLNDNTQDATWTSYFGNVTFNFGQDKFSLDAGLRYSKAEKDPTLRSYNSAWIFDVTPCRGDGSANTDENFRGDTRDWGGIPVQDIDSDGTQCVAGIEPEARRIDAADALFLTNTLQNRSVNTDNLWYVPRGGERDTPSTWRGSYTAAVGMTPFTTVGRDNEQWSNLDQINPEDVFGTVPVTEWDNWDPQIVLRYRPTPELSTYFKYATAFKAGGYDLGFGGSQPRRDREDQSLAELQIDEESSETFELGASGTLFDRRVRYQAVLFRVDFDDLIATTVTGVGTDDQSTQVINIGKQRAQGLEIDADIAWTDQLTLRLYMSVLDSKFTFFPNANCTLHETVTAESSGCQIAWNPAIPEGDRDPRNPDHVDFALIDRAGQTAPFSPEFGMTTAADYWMPFRDYRVDFGATVTYQTEYFTDFREFDKSNIQKAEADLNLHVGIGDMDGKWRVGLALRNLLEPRSTFRPDFTSDITELGTEDLRTRQVKSLALTFKYNFFE